ncbi:BQ5605_C006g03859 [Microbotryum silenes-dioicae]|nr:BQ5605_C006g03859 [Microbotryum silenes-dioicae]
MAELSAPAGLVDAHAMRRSWLLKGQNSLDNTGHHNCSLIFCFICIRLLVTKAERVIVRCPSCLIFP